MSYRLFAALPIPDEICDMLKPMQKGIDGAKWRHKENLHLTLSFYGDVTDHTAHDLDAALAEINMPPITLRLKDVGQFGGYEPHTLWAGIAENAQVAKLAKQCRKPIRELNLKHDKYTYTPHITLAYLSAISPRTVSEYLARHAMFETPEFTVNKFVLYSSRPGKYQSFYQEEATYPLI